MTNKPTVINAIVSLKADAKVILQNEDYDTLVWEDDNPTGITNDQITVELKRLNIEWTANQYQRDRQYPSIGDQLDMQYHDQLNGTTTWQDAVAKVKSDNPK